MGAQVTSGRSEGDAFDGDVHAEHPRSWAEWYRFAAEELGYGHDECVEYANLRYVEEQNREALRRSAS
jgi:hypothetical protein